MLSINKDLIQQKGVRVVVQPVRDKQPAPTPAVKINTSPIHYLMNDPSTPNLTKDVAVPAIPTNPAFNVVGYQGGGFDVKSIQGQAASVVVTMVDSINAVNVYSEKKMARWASARTLMVLPRAGRMFNAFYDRKTLSFFYDRDPVTGEDIYTAASANIVAHELGHAILDTFRPDLWSVAFMEVWAFHEAFGDINAFLSMLRHDEIINYMLRQTDQDLSQSNVATEMAEQLGRAIFHVEGPQSGRNENWLRNLKNDFRYVNPTTLPSDGPDNTLCAEPHNFSRVFSAAIYDIFVMMYNDQKSKGVTPLQAVKNARDVLARYMFKAIQNVPVQPTFFEAMAKTILWCDWSTHDRPYHDRMHDIFVHRHIIQAVSVMWHKPFTPSGSTGLKTLKVGNHVHGLMAMTHNPLYNVEVQVSDHSHESVEAAHHMIRFLHETKNVGPREDTQFEISNGKLFRSNFACGCGCLNQPTKFQPEFYKPYKPQNNNGCGCGRPRPDPTIVNRPTVKKGCFVRYRVVK